MHRKMSQARAALIMTHILFSHHGRAAYITLNRPEALNALTIEMVNAMSEALLAWADDDDVGLVVITSSSARSFCAGGDVRQAVSVINADPKKGAEPYFNAEYGFDKILANYKKPVVTLVDGIVMGGGFGVARLARHMVISSSIKMAMPETAIGLFPDVGASCFLRRAPLAAALMMGMTGTVIGAGDAMAWQLADYHCSASHFDSLKDALSHCQHDDDIPAVIARYQTAPPEAHFAHQMDDITALFGSGRPAEIAQKTKIFAANGDAGDWHKALTGKCPMSIAAFWYMMTQLDVPSSNAAAIERDYFLACKMTRRTDFKEGVRAVLIDKDNKPAWRPSSLAEIDDETLSDLFDFKAMPPLPA